MLGPFIDRIGIKKSLVVSSLIAVVGGFMITFVQQEGTFIFALIFIMPLAAALSFPAGKIAPRRYTDSATRSVAYSAFFVAI